MSVYKRGGVYWMDFVYRGTRVQQSTGQITKDAALAVERQLKDEVRQRAHGVAVEEKALTPRFQDWAETYYTIASGRVRHPERIKHLVRGVLRFFGAKPTDRKKVYPDAPYHDLRLGDVVTRPAWLLEWETWLHQSKVEATGKRAKKRVWSGQTKNQYRSALSQMFAYAMKPQYRAMTGIEMNPCAGMERDRRHRRTVALNREDLQAIIGQASYHLRLAMAIALLAPKLRVGNILKLRFDQHFSANMEWLTMTEHKTAHHTGRPLVAYIPEQLREILAAAKARLRKSGGYVITYQGKPVAQLRGAVLGAVERAAVARPHLKYGRDTEAGITFHTLRHSASTLFSELNVPLELHKGAMGHERIETTLWYSHLRPVAEQIPVEALSAALPIKDLVLVERRRPPAAAKATIRSKRRSAIRGNQ